MQPVSTPRVFSGRYELTHLVARGGMAEVYRAHDRLLDRPVALKILFPELSVDRAFVERFRREAQAAANLSHPNIVPVFDWGEDTGTYYIVMEYVDGQPLSQALRSGGPMAPERVAYIGARVAEALAYAHRHGVVHRDVKPGNVLLTSDDQVKVTDFGIARAINTEDSLTQTGAVMGTATYFSPEQAEGHGVDSRSDIYSLGVVLYEMVAGRPPFLGDSPVAVASKHVRDTAPPLRDLNPTVPPALEDVIAKAMAKSTSARYQSATDLRADLQRFLDGHRVSAADAATGMLAATPGAGTTVVSATQAVPVAGAVVERTDESTHVWRWLLLLLALLVILGVVVYFVLQSLGYIGGPNRFAMPTVARRTVPAARSILSAKGLDVTGRTAAHSTTIPPTDVISTDPHAGAKVTKGEHVSLLVSSGPVAKLTVPTVVGEPYSKAAATLSSDGFRVTAVEKGSTEPTGTVLSESPPRGTKTKKDAKVVLTVSTQNSVAVPSVVGDSTAAAGGQLGASGLTVGPTTPGCSSKYGTGEVMAQTPAAGKHVPPKAAVALVVSTGSCNVTVPTVVGQPATTASADLSSRGLGVKRVTTVACVPTTDGKVTAQTPTGGRTEPSGTPVTIDVCKAPTTAPKTPPPTTTTTTAPPKTVTHGKPSPPGPTPTTAAAKKA